MKQGWKIKLRSQLFLKVSYICWWFTLKKNPPNTEESEQYIIILNHCHCIERQTLNSNTFYTKINFFYLYIYWIIISKFCCQCYVIFVLSSEPINANWNVGVSTNWYNNDLLFLLIFNKNSVYTESYSVEWNYSHIFKNIKTFVENVLQAYNF